MINKSYDFLKPYHYSTYNGYIEWPKNVVFDVEMADIRAAETILGRPFPDELLTFYKEVGYARISSPENPASDYEFFATNEVLPPLVAAHFYQGIKKYHESPFDEALCYEDHYLANDILDLLEPGDLPFFEISDSSQFMVMKLHSDNPNAVWFLGHEKIEDSLEGFIRNLYFKDPEYYLDKLK